MSNTDTTAQLDKKRGKEEEVLFSSIFNICKSVCRGYGKGTHLAVYSAVCIKLFRQNRLADLAPDGNLFVVREWYLIRCAKHGLADYWKRRRREKIEYPVPDAQEIPSDISHGFCSSISQIEARDALNSIFSYLSNSKFKVLLPVFIEMANGQSQRDACRGIMSVSTFRAKKKRLLLESPFMRKMALEVFDD